MNAFPEALTCAFQHQFLRKDCQHLLELSSLEPRERRFLDYLLFDEVSDELERVLSNIRELKEKDLAVLSINETDDKVMKVVAHRSLLESFWDVDIERRDLLPFAFEIKAIMFEKQVGLHEIFSRNYCHPSSVLNNGNVRELTHLYFFNERILFHEDEFGDFTVKKDNEIADSEVDELSSERENADLMRFSSPDKKTILYVRI